MTGSLSARPFLALSLTILVGLATNPSRPALAQAPPETIPGQLFVIEEPINSDLIEKIKASTKQYLAKALSQKSDPPILVFEFSPGKSQPGTSSFGSSLELAEFLSTQLEGAKFTVAYIPKPLTGYAVIPALACTEIVMGKESSIGPITPEGESVKAGYREPVKDLARRKGKSPDLFAGLLDRNAALKLVKTNDGQVHYVMAENLPEFLKANPAEEKDIQPAWEGGSLGILKASRAREENFARLVTDDRAVIANVFNIDSKALSSDPTLWDTPRPVWINIEGKLDAIKEAYLRRRIDQARRERVNLIFFKLNTEGGLIAPADNIATLIASTKDMKTVAYIDDRATGLSTLIALACDDIVFRKDARIGGVTHIRLGGKGQGEPLKPEQIETLTKRAETIASQKGHPAAVAHAMVEPNSKIVQAINSETSAPCLVLQSQVDANPQLYLNPSTFWEGNRTLVVKSGDAASFGLGQEVMDDESFKQIYGLRGKLIRIDGPTWVDGLVTTLNDPFVSWVLLFIGVFMLILEIKMPGVGLPAITSALAFLLFFWSRYLSGTADQLEILLFLVGLICLGLELFVFPGFGIFGLSGFLLIVISIVMASHTFIWPTQEYEYRQMAGTLFQIVAVMFGVGISAALVGKYIPSLPVFNRMVLKPETYNGSELDDPTAKPSPDEGYESLAFLMGETGRTTTVLKPSGKARFGNLLIDVRADGYFIEPDRLIEVIDVQGMKVIVKPIG